MIWFPKATFELPVIEIMSPGVNDVWSVLMEKEADVVTLGFGSVFIVGVTSEGPERDVAAIIIIINAASYNFV